MEGHKLRAGVPSSMLMGWANHGSHRYLQGPWRVCARLPSCTHPPRAPSSPRPPQVPCFATFPPSQAGSFWQWEWDKHPSAGSHEARPHLQGKEELPGVGGQKQSPKKGSPTPAASSSLSALPWPGTILGMCPLTPIAHQLGLPQPPELRGAG